MVGSEDPMLGGPSTWRRGLSWAIVVAITLALAAMLIAFGVFAGFRGSSAGRDITIEDEWFAIELEVPAGVGIDSVHTRTGGDPDCRKIMYGFGDELTVEAVARDCRIESPQDVMNGDHGTYRTLADVPEPVGVRDVDTGIGPAKVFVQHYEEYTNVSNEWEEPVAIVTLDAPDDPDFPTLVLRSARGELSRERFTEVVASLEAGIKNSAG